MGEADRLDSTKSTTSSREVRESYCEVQLNENYSSRMYPRGDGGIIMDVDKEEDEETDCCDKRKTKRGVGCCNCPCCQTPCCNKFKRCLRALQNLQLCMKGLMVSLMSSLILRPLGMTDADPKIAVRIEVMAFSCIYIFFKCVIQTVMEFLKGYVWQPVLFLVLGISIPLLLFFAVRWRYVALTTAFLVINVIGACACFALWIMMMLAVIRSGQKGIANAAEIFSFVTTFILVVSLIINVVESVHFVRIIQNAEQHRQREVVRHLERLTQLNELLIEQVEDMEEYVHDLEAVQEEMMSGTVSVSRVPDGSSRFRHRAGLSGLSPGQRYSTRRGLSVRSPRVSHYTTGTGNWQVAGWMPKPHLEEPEGWASGLSRVVPPSPIATSGSFHSRLRNPPLPVNRRPSVGPQQLTGASQAMSVRVECPELATVPEFDPVRPETYALPIRAWVRVRRPDAGSARRAAAPAAERDSMLRSLSF